MSAYQSAGNAYQGAGQFAYQDAGVELGTFGEPLAIHHVGAPSGRLGAAPEGATVRIGDMPRMGSGRIGS